MPVLSEKSVVSPVWVGRADEVRALRRLTEQAQGGQGQTVFISGEAGLGKSRLVAEIVAYGVARGFTHWQGHNFQPDSARPYAPCRDWLRSARPALLGNRALADDPEQAHGVVVNPDKSKLITFSEHDRVIVLAES